MYATGDCADAPVPALDADGTQRVRDLVSREYGIIGTALIRLHKLFKGADGSVGIAMTPE